MFEKKAAEFAKRLLVKLEGLKENISALHMERKKAKEVSQKEKGKQKTLFSCFERKVETTMESSSSDENSSLDSDY